MCACCEYVNFDGVFVVCFPPAWSAVCTSWKCDDHDDDHDVDDGVGWCVLKCCQRIHISRVGVFSVCVRTNPLKLVHIL